MNVILALIWIIGMIWAAYDAGERKNIGYGIVWLVVILLSGLWGLIIYAFARNVDN